MREMLGEAGREVRHRVDASVLDREYDLQRQIAGKFEEQTAVREQAATRTFSTVLAAARNTAGAFSYARNCASLPGLTRAQTSRESWS